MNQFSRFVGLDESKDTIQVALADAGALGEVREYGSIPNTPDSLGKLLRRLGPWQDALFAYEAGLCGYETYRFLRGRGAECLVVAPSKTPRRVGDRIKNDRRDAVTLARLLRAGELTPVWVPDEETEAMRDLTRAREDAKYAQTRARQRLLSFLLRHGRRYPGKSHWVDKHLRWLITQRFSHPSQQVVLGEYLGAVDETTRRVQRLDQQITELVPAWSMGPVVQALMTLRGVSWIVASTVVAELGDLARFERARELMGFVGLVPSLRASGQSHQAGGITKTGNSHVRRCLVEAAWAYRHTPKNSIHLRRRLKGQPEEVLQLAWKAQLRLCGQYRKLRARGKHQNKVITAIARELVGFIWAIARTVSPSTVTASR